MAVALRLPLLSPHLLPTLPLSHQNPTSDRQSPLPKWPRRSYSRRDAIILTSIVLPAISLAPPRSAAATDSPEKANGSTRKPFLEGIVNTKSWFQYFGDGFTIRAPPLFDDVLEPEASVLFNPWISIWLYVPVPVQVQNVCVLTHIRIPVWYLCQFCY